MLINDKYSNVWSNIQINKRNRFIHLIRKIIDQDKWLKELPIGFIIIETKIFVEKLISEYIKLNKD